MTALTFASTPVVVLEIKDNCRRAAMLMSRHQVRHLPVLDEAIPVGMVSDRDLLSAIGRWEADAGHPDGAVSDWADRLCVQDIMSSPLICAAPDESLECVISKMLSNRISAVAVKLDNRLLGIVTETDCLRSYTGEWEWQRQQVLDHMTANVHNVSPEEPIHRAWRLMHDKRIRHLIVSHKGGLLGILSDRDILGGITWETAGPKGIRDQVRKIMTPEVATVAPHAALTEVAKEMVRRRIGALPVCDERGLVGIITETDLLRAMVAVTGGEK